MHDIRNSQSPYTSDDFWAKWSSVTPRMCTCLLITPKAEFGGSSAAKGFTSNTRDMELPGHEDITFMSTPGLSPSAVEMALDEPPNLEVMGIYQAGVITQAEIAAGKWDFAAVELFCVCWDNPDLGEFVQVTGNLGKFADRQTYFNTEIRGLIARLVNDTHEETSQLCRAPKFRDPVKCKHTAATVDIEGDTYNIEHEDVELVGVPTSSDSLITIDTSTFTGNVPPAGFFRNGEITGMTGPNAGVSREIAYNEAESGGQMDLQLKRPFPFGMTGTFMLTAGCDKTEEMCVLYENVLNRRAEDHIPGIETITRVK